MPRRTYGQYCALARTLDLVGERWTLLVVRELLFGPRRYTDLLGALDGIGTSLLAERLKRLEDADVVRRRELPPPAASTVYEFTAAGEELARALLPLAMWGARHLLGPIEPGEQFRVVWPLMIMRELFDPAKAEGVDATYEFVVEGSIGHLRIHDSTMEVRDGPAPEPPDARVVTDVETFAAIGLGRLDPSDAVTEGRVTVEGNPAAFLNLLAMVGIGPDVRDARGEPASAPS